MFILPKGVDIQLRFRVSGELTSILRASFSLVMDQSPDHTTQLKQLVKMWLRECKIESNRDLPFLNIAEGGLGGDSNQHNKQIRFHIDDDSIQAEERELVFDVFHAEAGTEKWSVGELIDLVQAFENFSQRSYKEISVEGVIVIRPLQ